MGSWLGYYTAGRQNKLHVAVFFQAHVHAPPATTGRVVVDGGLEHEYYVIQGESHRRIVNMNSGGTAGLENWFGR